MGALGFFVALGLEWTSLRHIRRGTTAEEIREWMRLPDELGQVGMISMVTLLAAGFYMILTAWGGVAWLIVALGAIVLLIILAMGITRQRVAAIGKVANTDHGPLSSTLNRLVHDPVLWVSMQTRLAIALGIVFLMTAKPGFGGSLLIIGVAIVLGLGSAFPVSRRERVQEGQADWAEVVAGTTLIYRALARRNQGDRAAVNCPIPAICSCPMEQARTAIARAFNLPYPGSYVHLVPIATYGDYSGMVKVVFSPFDKKVFSVHLTNVRRLHTLTRSATQYGQ